MAQQVQRTIVVTVVETWTLIYAESSQSDDEHASGAGHPELIAGNPGRHRHTPMAQTITVSASVTIFTKGEERCNTGY